MRKRFGDKFANAVVAAALLSTSSTTAQVVDHYYLDPKNVAEISKFRSCAGHHFGYDDTFSGIGVREVETDPTETNRSMKHYFSPLQSLRENGSNNTLELHAPFDGTIYRVTSGGHETGYENKEVWIQSDVSPDTFAIVFHVNLLDLFPDFWNDYPPQYWPHHGADDPDYERLTVSSGEVIGYADLRGTISDIAILKKVSSAEYHYLSYFDDDVMTEQIFALYQRYGLNSRGDVIISKEVRNANPLPADCWGGRREGDWFRLTKADEIGSGESSDEVSNVFGGPVDGQIHMGVGNLRGRLVKRVLRRSRSGSMICTHLMCHMVALAEMWGMRFQMYPALENQAIRWRLPTQIYLLVIIPLRPLLITPTGWWQRALHRSRSRSLRKALSLILMRSI